jgi:hypothetical protein
MFNIHFEEGAMINQKDQQKQYSAHRLISVHCIEVDGEEECEK